MYRRTNTTVGMSGIFDSLFKAVKGAVSGIKITAPPINLPTVNFPSTVQIPGTVAPQPAPMQMAAQSGSNDWVMPVALGGLGLLAVVMLSQRGRR